MTLSPDVGCAPSVARFAGRGVPATTLVATTEGRLPVEYLAPGDRIITRHNAVQTLRQIIPHTQTCARVQIAADSLGHHGPGPHTVLPHAQPVFIRDWRALALFGTAQAVAPVSELVDTEYVTQLTPHRMYLFELIFDAAQVIYAGGVELAAFTTVETLDHGAATAPDLRTQGVHP